MATWYLQTDTWDDTANWTANFDGTGANPSEIPWTGETTKDDDLEEGQNYPGYCESYATLDGGTGICSIVVISIFSSTINGGTFTGFAFSNYGGYIHGGTFTGSDFANNGTIYGGTFTGEYFANNNEIFDGTFTGSYFSNNNGYIYGGTFTGSGFYNSSGYIYGGAFTGSGFYNSYGFIYGGMFTGSDFSHDSGFIHGGFWWLKGSAKINGVNLRASGDASPFTNFMTLETSDILGSGLL